MAEDERAQPASSEDLLRQVEEELRKLTVGDVLLQACYTVSSLGYRRLSKEDRDLEQARLAIDALRALVPVLKEAAPEQTVRDLQQVVANMQLAYAGAVGEPEAEPEPERASPPESEPNEEDDGGG